MGSTYEIWLCDDRGRRVDELTHLVNWMNYVKVTNGAGWLDLALSGKFDNQWLKPDRQLQIWRRPDQDTPQSLDFLCYMNRWNFQRQGEVVRTVLSGPDQNSLLARRIVAYYSGHANAIARNVPADDAMKAVVRTNFIESTAGAGRGMDDWNFQVEENTSLGPNIYKAFAWRNVMDILQELNLISRGAGSEIFFGLKVSSIDPSSFVPTLRFQTKLDYAGADQSQETGSGTLTFGEEWGNLIDSTMVYDYVDIGTYAYAGGPGEGPLRLIGEASDTAAINQSIFGRRELFKDSRGLTTTEPAALVDAAEELLAENRRRKRFTGTLLDTDQARYGRDWKLGDKGTITAFGEQFSGIIRSVRVAIGQDRIEKVISQVDGEF